MSDGERRRYLNRLHRESTAKQFAALVAKGWTLEELAKELGESSGQVRGWASGEKLCPAAIGRVLQGLGLKTPPSKRPPPPPPPSDAEVIARLRAENEALRKELRRVGSVLEQLVFDVEEKALRPLGKTEGAST